MKKNPLRLFLILFLLCLAIILSFAVWTNWIFYEEQLTERELPALGVSSRAQLTAFIDNYQTMVDQLQYEDVIAQWIRSGEKDQDEILDYLKQKSTVFDCMNVSFVSDRSETYFGSDGNLLTLSLENKQRDGWYYHFRNNGLDENMDAWYYPEENHLGLFINQAIRDENGQFLGVLGCGFYADEITQFLLDFKEHYQIELSLFRLDGQMIYSTEESLFDITHQNWRALWDEGIIEHFRRERNNTLGSVFTAGENGTLLWSGFIEDWETFLVIDKSSATLATESSFRIRKTLIRYGILETSLLVVFLFIYFRLKRKGEAEEEAVHHTILRFQSVVFGQNQLLKLAEKWIPGDPLSEERQKLQSSRLVLRSILGSEKAIQGRVLDLAKLLLQVLMEKTKDFASEEISLISRIQSERCLICSYEPLIRILFYEILEYLRHSPIKKNSPIIVSIQNTGTIIGVSFLVSICNLEFPKESEAILAPVLEVLHAHLSIAPVAPHSSVLRLSFNSEVK